MTSEGEGMAVWKWVSALLGSVLTTGFIVGVGVMTFGPYAMERPSLIARIETLEAQVARNNTALLQDRELAKSITDLKLAIEELRRDLRTLR